MLLNKHEPVIVAGCDCSRMGDSTRIKFIQSEISVIVSSAEERAIYGVVYYWDLYDFKDTLLVFSYQVTV